MTHRIDVPPEEVISRISAWYQPAEQQLITVAALDTGSQMELQWIFSAYGKLNEVTVFRSCFDYAATIPSLVRTIPSAWMIEREIADLFGVRIEGAKPGLMLDSESLPSPLRKKR